MPTYGFRDRAVAERLKQMARRGRDKYTVLPPPQSPPYIPGLVRFYNSSGETVPKRGCMKILSETKVTGEGITVTIDKPDDVFKLRYLVNLDREIANSKYGWGIYLDEADWVLRDATGTPAPHQMWGPNPGSWALFQHCPGFLATGASKSEDGSTYLYAKQHTPHIIYGIAQGAILEDATTGIVEVCKQLSTVTTGQTIQSCTNLSMDIDDNGPVTVAFPNGEPYPLVAGLKCPAA